jgi:hypothetical protein
MNDDKEIPVACFNTRVLNLALGTLEKEGLHVRDLR